MKIYALADGNSFFASCEKVFNPQWCDRPLVVLSNNDGCIVARSAEAKPLVPMGVPYFQIKNIAERCGIVVRSSNFSLYGDMSRRVMQTLSTWTPEVEVYSIDEAFLDLTGRFAADIKANRPVAEPLAALCAEVVETVPRWTGIPVSLGVGPTKTLAKAANRIAKKRSDRFCSLLDPAERAERLAQFDVADIWGVGRHLLPKFRRLGLRTAADLASVDPLWIRRNFSVVQEMTVRELRAERCFDWESQPEPRQNIQVSRSFGEMLSDLDPIASAVASFVTEGARRLRRQGSVASAVMVRLDTNRYRTDMEQHHAAELIGFDRPTDDTPTILAAALGALRRICRSGIFYKRAMIQLVGLCDREASRRQRTFFDDARSDERFAERGRLMAAVDALNESMGRGTLFYAAEGVRSDWKPNSRFVSPCYTTRWSDLPVVKAK